MFKKGDFVIIFAIIATAVISAFLLYGSGGSAVVLTLDGEEYGKYSLLYDRNVKIETENGSNTLVIKDGAAFFTDSDCPDKLCEKSGKLTKKGDAAVCLPHKLVAEVV